MANRNLEQEGFEPSYDRKRFIETIEAEGEVHGWEAVWNKKDGSIIFMRENARVIRDSNGKSLYYDGTVEDFTERNRTEFELIKAKEKAEESDRLKTAFLQNMSHEIRSPMNAIMGFSSILKNYVNQKDKLEKYASIINQRSADLLDIINDILDIAKIESGQLTLKLEECNLSELFEELTIFFKEYQQRINKEHIKLELDCDAEMKDLTILTDKVKLKQIFINLIGNAFKFTKEGSITGGCRLNGHSLEFYVTDTGIGIPENKLEEVFERFAQLNQEGQTTFGGTGLGLSIVKGLITLLGGEITLTSEVDKGSSFTFTIAYSSIH